MRPVSLFLLAACGPLGSPANAALNGVLAVSAAAYERSQGRCYAACPHGTACNHETGYCDPLPCRGECRAGQVCQETPTGDRCLPPLEVDFLATPPPDAAPDAPP